MDELQKALFLGAVEEACEGDPSLVTPVINAATRGVKAFADNQSNRTGKMAFKLFSVLEQTPASRLRFKPFTKEEVVDEITPTFQGTTGLKRLKEKLGIAETE